MAEASFTPFDRCPPYDQEDAPGLSFRKVLAEGVIPDLDMGLVTAEGPTHKRFPKVYEIDLLRCIFCGFCQEACPYGAIILRENYETGQYTRKDLLYDRDRLFHAYQK